MAVKEMINCSKCGAPLEDNSFFCSSCGQIVKIAAGNQPAAATAGATGSQGAQQMSVNSYGSTQSNQQSPYNSYGSTQASQQSPYNSYNNSYGNTAAFTANQNGYGAGQNDFSRAAYNNQNGYSNQNSYNSQNDYNANNYTSAVSAVTAAQKRKIFTFGKERKEQRYNLWGDTELLSDNAYSGWLGGTVLYGLLVNLIICMIVEKNIYEIAYNVLSGSGYIIMLIAYFVLCFAGTIISNASTKPLVSFIGYNLVVFPVGFLVSLSVFAFGGISSSVVTTAVFITLAVTFIMTALSIAKPQFFESVGKVLGTTLLVLLVVSAISALLSKDYFIWTYIGAGLFSLYIGYDISRAMQFPHTKDNAIDCALDIYLDIINLFLRILKIMAKANSKRK